LQGRPFQRPAGYSAVVIVSFETPPALVGLALDVSLGSLALGIEGVEVLFEAVLRGLARI
jgi:hypothetical protein